MLFQTQSETVSKPHLSSPFHFSMTRPDTYPRDAPAKQLSQTRSAIHRTHAYGRRTQHHLKHHRVPKPNRHDTIFVRISKLFRRKMSGTTSHHGRMPNGRLVVLYLPAQCMSHLGCTIRPGARKERRRITNPANSDPRIMAILSGSKCRPTYDQYRDIGVCQRKPVSW